MKKLLMILATSAVVAPLSFSQNLLVNGDMNTPDPNDSSKAFGWTHWNFGNAWSLAKVLGPQELDPNSGSHGGNDILGIYDSSTCALVGCISGENYSGVYQDFAVTPGTGYKFAFDYGAEAWWLPWAEINIVFYSEPNVELYRARIRPTNPLNNAQNGGIGDFYDKGIVFQRYQVIGSAPANATLARAEMVAYGQANAAGTWGGGNSFLDNASVTETGTLSGSVTLEGWLPSPEGQILNLEISQGGNPVETVPAYVEANGSFVAATTATGTVTVRAKGSHWLSNSAEITIGSTSGTFFLKNGDCDGNNVITTDDYLILSNSFDKSVGDEGYDSRADLDGNESITTDDYLLLSNNFDLEGE